MGYVPMEPPAVDSFVPHRVSDVHAAYHHWWSPLTPHWCWQERTFRVGAVEESGVRAPRDVSVGWHLDYLLADSIDARPEAAEAQARDPEAIMEKLFTPNVPVVDSQPEAALALFADATPRVQGLEYLRTDTEIASFASCPVPHETDLDWALRPQPVPHTIPATYRACIANSIGTATIHAYDKEPTISQTWRPRRQRRSSSLVCLEHQHRQFLWNHEGIPQPLVQSDQHDIMSDSESEDEGDDTVSICSFPNLPRRESLLADSPSSLGRSHQIVLPTAELAKKRFEEDAGTGTSDAVVNIKRDTEMLELERRATERREGAAGNLPSKILNVSTKISNVRHTPIQQRPFHLIMKEAASQKSP